MKSGDSRESALEALLSRRVRPGAATAGCLDAETLAAYAEGGLRAQALAEAEAHLAACAHCQVVMAAIVGSGEAVMTSPAAAPERAWWGQFRWLMPLAGAAAAVVLWMVVPAGDPAPRESGDATAAIEPRAEPPPPPSEAAPPPAPLAKNQEVAPAEAPAAAKKVTPEAANEFASRPADQTARERVEADAAAGSAAKPGVAEADLRARAEARGAPVAGAAPAAPPATEERTGVEAARAAPPPAPAALGSPASKAPAIDLRTLDPGVRWRLVDLGFVERSTSGGASWDRFDTGVRTPLRAGACLSASTCWVVGDAGVVLRTTDAQTWRPVTSPTAENLVAVETTGEAAAVVRAAGGQRFSTSDGGTNWTRVP